MPISFVVPSDISGSVAHLRIDDSQHPLHEWDLEVPVKVFARFGIGLILAAAIAAIVASILIYYARTYRHPLIVRLSGAPAELMALDVEELPRARRLLTRTGRLDTVLRGAESAGAWLDAAAGFAREPDPAKRVMVLARRLNPIPSRSRRTAPWPATGWNCRRIFRSMSRAAWSPSPSPARLPPTC